MNNVALHHGPGIVPLSDADMKERVRSLTETQSQYEGDDGEYLSSENCKTAEVTNERLVALGEQLREDAVAKVPKLELLTLGEKLMSIFEAPCLSTALKQRAGCVVAKLAAHNEAVLNLLIENAESYARIQHIDDAYPYSPNAFEVLADVRPIYEQVVSFLRGVARDDSGVARWSAAQALLTIEIQIDRAKTEADHKRLPSAVS